LRLLLELHGANPFHNTAIALVTAQLTFVLGTPIVSYNAMLCKWESKTSMAIAVLKTAHQFLSVTFGITAHLAPLATVLCKNGDLLRFCDLSFSSKNLNQTVLLFILGTAMSG
jgi:hypothetical protein